MYVVPMDIPQFCNKCPFGMLNYSAPFGGWTTSKIDGKDDAVGTHGYVCNIDFYENGRYTKVLRGNVDNDIPKPDWCQLRER